VQTGIWILGSCVTRDALHEEGEGFDLVEYSARTSLGSAFSRTPVDSVELSRISSPFQRRMVETDVKKLITQQIKDAKVDVYVVDLIDERFDLYEEPSGAICTLSNELLSSGFARDSGRVIASGSDEFYAIWERGWQTLVGLLQEKGQLHLLRLHKAYWSELRDDGSGFLPSYPAAQIAGANEFLHRLYARAERDLSPGQVIELPSELVVGATNHRWGVSPFHYVTSYYREFMRRLESTITKSPAAIASPPLSVAASPSPAGSLNARDIELTAEPVWFDLRRLAGATIAVRAALTGGKGVGERRALVTLDLGDGTRADLASMGLTQSHDPQVGAYRYLVTGPGSHETSFTLQLPPNADRLRLGVRSWWPEDRVRLDALNIGVVAPAASTTLLSVDVEALPGRSIGNQVEELIFGNIAGERGRGIARLCDIFADYGVRATFFVDYATCAVYGDDGIFRAADYIRSRGQDVQLHMHSEILVRSLGWHSTASFFDELDLPLALRVLEYGISKFEQSHGSRPRIFRPGALRKSQAMYAASRQLGISAISSVFRGYESTRWPAFGRDCVVEWSNGLREIPLDLALDPLQAWEPFESKVRSFRAERPNGSVSLLIHSTSLLYRERPAAAHFTHYHQPYEAQLIRYLEMLAPGTRFISHSDALDEITPHSSTISLEWANAERAPIHSVNAPGRTQERAGVSAVPSPEAGTALVIPRILDDHAGAARCAPPTALPVRLVDRQTLHTVVSDRVGWEGAVAYVVSGYKAYVVGQRGSLPTGDVLRELIDKIFARHPAVSKLIVEWTLNDFSEFPEVSPTVARKTFVLDLPESFERYRLEFISRELRRDIEREERRANEELSGVRFELAEAPQITVDLLQDAATLVEEHLSRKDSASSWRAADLIRNSEVYASRGFVARLVSSGRTIAAGLCLLHRSDECYLMAAAHDERLTKQSLGKICLYRLIEALIARGIRKFHMGGGDFGYKSRFGAVERALYNVAFERRDHSSMIERVERALRAGAAPFGIEREINQSLEDVLGERFEVVVGVDFDKILENREIGTGEHSQRYQATIGNVFDALLEPIPPSPDDVFVDVGAGKGKMLYYAARRGFTNLVGIELSSKLIPLAEQNLKRLELRANVTLLQRDAGHVAPSEIAHGTVFYLYNPFSEEVLGKFLESVLQSRTLHGREIKVVYCNARYPEPFRQRGFTVWRQFRRDVDGWRYDDSVIYELA
jgi:16S rRNA G966 N2-methylase RsmD